MIYYITGFCELYIFHNIFLFFFTDTSTTEIYTLSLHDALPILVLGCPRTDDRQQRWIGQRLSCFCEVRGPGPRSEEHTSELQSRRDLVCRLLLEKKK